MKFRYLYMARVKTERRRSSLRKLWRNNSLSIVVFGLFFIFLGAESVAGFFDYNEDLQEKGQPQVGYLQFLTSGRFIEATTENWESEFLEMSLFILLTAWLVQKGSAESKKPGEGEPRRARPLSEKLYGHSLTMALGALFLISFCLHVVKGAEDYSREQQAAGKPAVSVIQFLGSARLWFQSFQNWQSEFLGVGSVILLSVFLRERGSPQSKPVGSSNRETGG